METRNRTAKRNRRTPAKVSRAKRSAGFGPFAWWQWPIVIAIMIGCCWWVTFDEAHPAESYPVVINVSDTFGVACSTWAVVYTGSAWDTVKTIEMTRSASNRWQFYGLLPRDSVADNKNVIIDGWVYTPSGSDTLKDPIAYQLNTGRIYIVDSVTNINLDSLSISYVDSVGRILYGVGDYTVTMYAIDTSGVDDTLSGVLIEVNNSANGHHAYGWTESPGYVNIKCDSGDYYWTARLYAYSTPLDTHTITSDTTLWIGLYDMFPSLTPSSPVIAYVVGRVIDISGNGLKDVTVTMESSGTPTVDTSATQNIVAAWSVSTLTDSTGYFQLAALRTSAYDDTSKGVYTIGGKKGPGEQQVFEIERFRVPDTGNTINLGIIYGGRIP